MAPEVALSKPYSHRAEVFAFGTLVWQMLAHERPFADCDVTTFYQRVCHRGERPKIPRDTPPQLAECVAYARTQQHFPLFFISSPRVLTCPSSPIHKTGSYCNAGRWNRRAAPSSRPSCRFSMSCYVNTATIGRRPHQGARAARGAPPAVEDEDTYSLYYQGIRYERFLTSKTFLGYGNARRDRAELRRYGGSKYLGKERRRVGTSVGASSACPATVCRAARESPSQAHGCGTDESSEPNTIKVVCVCTISSVA